MPIAPIRILAIDDRTDALLPIRVLMTRDGHQVVEAQNGPDGVHLAKSFHPDMVLCDIGLPGAMNGYDVAQAMRADPELKKLYLVALSGYSQPSDRKRAQTSGFDFHVAKPIKLAMLRNLVANRPRF
jgi:CheY-like chemotaxis protein